jgi:hypothetical protein
MIMILVVLNDNQRYTWQEQVIFWWDDDEDEYADDDGDDDDDQIGRVMASTLISSGIDCGFNAGRIKPL